MSSVPLKHEDYKIGWISAHPFELAAATLLLDEEHPTLTQPENDENSYTLGRIGVHNVVIAVLPAGRDGPGSAAMVATNIKGTFKNLRFGLLVGIGSGVPTDEHDIRLGDVVISKPSGIYSGAVQYDSGTAESEGLRRTGFLNSPPQVLLSTLARFQAKQMISNSTIHTYLAKLEQRPAFRRPDDQDTLFLAAYKHFGGKDCGHCERNMSISRPNRDEAIDIHYGTIASGHQRIRDSVIRDQRCSELGGILCFEMEAAGLMNSFPCMIIRGICDYADSHANAKWQRYSAGVAAACARDIITMLPAAQVENTKTIEESQKYRIPFSLQGVPVTDKFVNRPDMVTIEETLLPRKNLRRKVLVLSGLGGIGKTQLAVEFARKYQETFSTVFWFDASSETNLKQSIASCARRIPKDQLPKEFSGSRTKTSTKGHEAALTTHLDEILDQDIEQDLETFAQAESSTQQGSRPKLHFRQKFKAMLGSKHEKNTGKATSSRAPEISTSQERLASSQVDETSTKVSEDIELAVRIVIDWLASPGNNNWLLVFDNVDTMSTDPNGYEITKYFPSPDHGSILITSRLHGLGQQWNSHGLDKVDQPEAIEIFNKWYGSSGQDQELLELLNMLDGLPLAIAQAAAFTRQTGTGIKSYIDMYRGQGKELMKLQHQPGIRLQDYALKSDRSIWTTWMISFDAIKKKSPTAANLLLLWSYLNNSDLWYGLFETAQNNSSMVKRELLSLLHVQLDEFRFIEAMSLLLSYSMVQRLQTTMETEGYATHPVLHDWARKIQTQSQIRTIGQLAVLLVGFNVTIPSKRDAHILYRRLFPHTQQFLELIARIDIIAEAEDLNIDPSTSDVYGAIHWIALLYNRQGKLVESQYMYQRAVKGREKALGPDHSSTMDTVNDLGVLYWDQGKHAEAEQMYQRALQGREKVLGPDHSSTLDTVNNLGVLYWDQGKLAEAEHMYQRALQGYEKAMSPDHLSTLDTVNNLGVLYWDQGKLAEAEQMYQRALQGYEKAMGPDHLSTLDTVNNLGVLYWGQGKLAEADQMYQRALQGREKVLGPDHLSTLDTVHNLGLVYRDHGKLAESKAHFQHALNGRRKLLGTEHEDFIVSMQNLALVEKELGNSVIAKDLLSKCLELRKKVQGEEHKNTKLTAKILEGWEEEEEHGRDGREETGMKSLDES